MLRLAAENIETCIENVCAQKIIEKTKIDKIIRIGCHVGHCIDHLLVIGVLALGIIGVLTNTMPLLSIGLIGVAIGCSLFLLGNNLMIAQEIVNNRCC